MASSAKLLNEWVVNLEDFCNNYNGEESDAFIEMVGAGTC